jgi:hypothetical protein
VSATIKLDDQAVGEAVEIDDVRADTMLAPEFDAGQPAVAKQSPQNSLGNRRVLSKLASSGLRVRRW